MGLSKYKFRELLQESFRKNQDLEFDISYVRGISNNKQITSTKANVDEAIIRKFYIVNPGEFVYNPRTTRMGDKVGLGFNNTETPLLFSFNNIAFFIKETAKATILPEYLYMYFNRPEFDRYAMINGWGSATELFSFEEMCDIEINLPPIDIQRKYVAVYNAMLANQQSYERGLEDLKLTCEILIDDYKHKAPKISVGDILHEVDNRNTDNSITDVQGINITKQFIFSPEYFEKLSDVKMPATKLELLIKMIRKQIKEYSKINKIAAKTYQEMLEETIAIYHERRKHISAEEAGATQEQASEDIIKNATEQALQILRQMNESRESFRKIGLTFEEKAFYDILVSLRDQYNFEYGEDKEIGGMIVNDKCKILAKKVKEIIDTKSSFSDWLNNQNVRNQLKLDIKICLVKNGYPPQYSPEVFTKVMEQVENFEENSDMPMATTYTFPQSRTVSMVAEDIIPYGNKSED